MYLKILSMLLLGFQKKSRVFKYSYFINKKYVKHINYKYLKSQVSKNYRGEDLSYDKRMEENISGKVILFR